MKINIIQFPFHLGRKNVGAGLGPKKYIQAGLRRRLAKQGFDVRTTCVSHNIPFDGEKNAVVRANRLLAKEVRKSIAKKELPLVLSGNCNCSLGVLAGLEAAKLKSGVVWFDAHGDFNTPETTPSGYLDGMPLAIAAGRCYKNARIKIGLRRPLPESLVLLAGVQSMDPLEKIAVARSKINLVPLKKMESLFPKLRRLASKTRNLYLHIDVDVLAKKLAPGVDFRTAGGLSLKDFPPILGQIEKLFSIRAVSITCYNPEKDKQNKTLKSAVTLVQQILHALK